MNEGGLSAWFRTEVNYLQRVTKMDVTFNWSVVAWSFELFPLTEIARGRELFGAT